MATPAENVRTLGGLSRLGWPRSYPVAQFPNLPLLVGVLGVAASQFTSGSAHDYASAVGTVGLAGWAWGEATEGENAFRHAIGIAGLVYLVLRLGAQLG